MFFVRLKLKLSLGSHYLKKEDVPIFFPRFKLTDNLTEDKNKVYLPLFDSKKI